MIPEAYLTTLDLSAVPTLHTDVLVLGSGVAGLSSALAASSTRSVLVISKDQALESNTYYAQGGVAAAMAPADSIAAHCEDTLAAGAGLCNPKAVRLLVEDGVDCCQQLLDWGTPFDQTDGRLAYTREGGHSERRVLHADGDATGRVMLSTMRDRAVNQANIRLLEHHFVIDLLCSDGCVYGALVLDTTYGRMLRVEAGATILATGGLGRIFRETTNPEVATGDGYALAFRAGSVLTDMEFIQFHPTTLYLPGAPRFLISEAVRGEGGYLLNDRGERFMERYCEAGELSPRDVVSQSILKEIARTGATHVSLDLRHLDDSMIERRFPNILRICADYGINVLTDLIPVRPSVHYMMGGVQTDLDGQTSVNRLLAAGEVACTGVHGANRLASNSLLEGLVFGRRAGRLAAEISGTGSGGFPLSQIHRQADGKTVPLDMDDVVRSLKALTWRHLGVFRSGSELAEARATIDSWERYILPEQFGARGGFEIQNMLVVAKVITHAASLRTESRGAHQRTDFPETNPDWARHIALTRMDFR